MKDRFVVLAMDNGRNWTGTANDCYVEIDPVSDSVATVWYRCQAAVEIARKRAANQLGPESCCFTTGWRQYLPDSAHHEA